MKGRRRAQNDGSFFVCMFYCVCYIRRLIFGDAKMDPNFGNSPKGLPI